MGNSGAPVTLGNSSQRESHGKENQSVIKWVEACSGHVSAITLKWTGLKGQVPLIVETQVDKTPGLSEDESSETGFKRVEIDLLNHGERAGWE